MTHLKNVSEVLHFVIITCLSQSLIFNLLKKLLMHCWLQPLETKYTKHNLLQLYKSKVDVCFITAYLHFSFVKIIIVRQQIKIRLQNNIKPAFKRAFYSHACNKREIKILFKTMFTTKAIYTQFYQQRWFGFRVYNSEFKGFQLCYIRRLLFQTQGV